MSDVGWSGEASATGVSIRFARPAAAERWGGYGGSFADPDG
ncbi:MAG TPA: hypothetical protein VFR44_05185 [Actinomycetota bacterium]|nr:hypothetical protein [Actinomycetota bacterium]